MSVGIWMLTFYKCLFSRNPGELSNNSLFHMALWALLSEHDLLIFRPVTTFPRMDMGSENNDIEEHWWQLSICCINVSLKQRSFPQLMTILRRQKILSTFFNFMKVHIWWIQTVRCFMIIRFSLSYDIRYTINKIYS